MGIIFGLAAALCWGLGDFAITTLARFVGTARCLLYIQLFSLASWIVLLAVFPHQATGGVNPWLLAALAGVFHVVGLATTYRAFEIGTLSFVSPIASSFAIVVVLITLATGKGPVLTALLGSLLLIAGIVVVTRSTGSEGKTTIRGVPEAVASAVCFGVMFWLVDGYVKAPLGDVYPLILLKMMATLFAVGYVAKSPPVSGAEMLSRSRLVWLALLAALLDTAAWVCALYGYKNGHVAVVTALASLFSVVTVVMAGIFLKERLNRLQWVGVVVVLGGILLVSLPR